ncbi:MAG: alpha/beta hydrolase [Bacteroidota bacterium]|nr:esterase family protein [Cytophagales bacterium]MCE2955814.1 esterase family protein [Flammeovirgaceae bacterium]MCZ8069477.1 alpha/beta hydrolase-fold protein [Cytophagales bacterium]
MEAESLKVGSYQSIKLTGIHSKLLERDVDVEILLPENFESSEQKYPLLILNDGQDNEAVRVKETIERLTQAGEVSDIVIAGITAGDRLQEYGVSAKADYKKRGTRAKAYTQYVVTELLPYLIYKYPIAAEAEQHAIAGYSMGGLSAMDIAWNHSDVFTKIGVFSGSLWWRKRDAHSVFYSDHRDRIMHQHIRRSKMRPGLKFWFQTGTEDEASDRNNNGIIDSIDDTLDLIAELTLKGYRPFKDIHYYEMQGGRHDTATWAKAMPEFLKWAFSKSLNKI